MIAIFDGVAGVEPQSETVWRQADKYNVPRICFVNKLDRMGADFNKCVSMISDRLSTKPLVVQLPIGIEKDFIGVVDLISMQAIIWQEDTLGAKFTISDIPQNIATKAEQYRKDLLETIAEIDPVLLEKYCNNEEISIIEVILAIRKGTLNNDFVPVLCGSAFKNKGVQPLLDAVIHFLPSPLDKDSISGTDINNTKELRFPVSCKSPMSALAFKVMNDQFVGSLTFARIYSGTLKVGTSILNATKKY